MKESKYNFFISDNDDNINLVYNSLRNTLISDKDRKVQNFIQQCNGNIKYDPAYITNDEFNDLISSGIIILDDFDEKQVAIDTNQMRLDILQKDNKRLSLTIAPTLQCNFKCYYCFESPGIRKNTSSMGLDVQNDIIDFITKSIAINHIKEVSITWCGGEPLLQLPIIISMQKKINKICKLFDVKNNNSSIITNGILLSAENCNLLYEHGIRNAQITIDGPEPVHNKRRHYPADPTNNYNLILKNILNANDQLKFIIRINVDNSNKDLILDLIDNLIERKIWPYKNKIFIYLAYVESDSNKVFSRNEFTVLQDHIRRNLADKYNDIKKTNKAKLKFHYPMYGGEPGCGYAISKNVWVVDYNGDVFRCWEAVGRKEHAIGTIKDLSEDFGQSIFEQIKLSNTVFEQWGCFDCKFFPICGSLCPWDYLDNEERRCTQWKNTLEYKILNQYKQFLKEPELFRSIPFNIKK